jgi:hypothetical protein
MAYTGFSTLLPNYGGGGAPASPMMGTTPRLPSFGNSPTPTMTGFSPSPLPSGTVSANSQGTGFGRIGPDLSYADPNRLGQLQSAFQGISYNLAGSGYVFNNPNHYIGGIPQGNYSDPIANQAASQYYNYLGSLPTRSYGSAALEKLYQNSGQKPAQGPSFNSVLQGLSSPPGFPNYLPRNQGGWTGPFGVPAGTGGGFNSNSYSSSYTPVNAARGY